MTDPRSAADSRTPLPDVNHRFGRLTRLALKELRETLRDRRTILTLVFMPLLLYPLMSIAFQRFFLTNLGQVAAPRFVIGFVSDDEMLYLSSAFRLGEMTTSPAETPTAAGGATPAESREISVDGAVRTDLEAAVRTLEVDAGLRLTSSRPTRLDPRGDVALDCELMFLRDSVSSRRAAEHIEQQIAAVNESFLVRRLEILGVSQRAVPVQVSRRELQNTGTAAPISIAAVIPFVLILMTVTGAVYPAIDLTAGERERGTLEILVAAPIPRLRLLLAKYVAVLTCAMLTAGANLIMMTVTIIVSGIGRLLFGDEGLSIAVMLAVAGLLVLFAAFFSAVLLMLTSFARSFKEAQAYLIPLMLVSLAPGMVSLMPGIELKGLLVVAPLMNIVLLGRDLFEYKATAGTTLAVVLSTSIYALVAISLAARVFGGESVLYHSQMGWSDLFRRAKSNEAAPNITSALSCLAILFPGYFYLNNLVARTEEVPLATRLLLASIVTASLFAGVPLLAAWHNRVRPVSGFALRWPAAVSWLAALLLGGSLWTLAHELVIITQKLGLVTLEAEQFDRARQLLVQLRDIPLPLVLVAMAVVPAVCEELFFRGYLFAAFLRHSSPRTSLFGTAVVFGLFHVVVTDALAIERLVPSTVLGLALAWMRLRSGSLFPGITVHACHNGLLMTISYFQPQLASAGWGLGEQEHLPVSWLGWGALAILIGFGLQWFTSPAPNQPSSTANPEVGLLDSPRVAR
jgi:ABC-2 type transport system permease protein/sodium transport system permease protein